MGMTYKLKPEIKNYLLEIKKENLNLSCRALVALLETKFQTRISKSSVNAIIKEAGLSMPVGRRLKKKRPKEIPKFPVEKEPEKPVEVPPEAKQEEKEKPEVPSEVKPEKPAEIPPVKPPEPEKPIEPPQETQPKIQITQPLEQQCTGAILLKAADYLLDGTCRIAELIHNQFRGHFPELIAKIEYLLYLPLFGASLKEPLKSDSALWPLIGKKFLDGDFLSSLTELQEAKILSSDLFRIISSVFQEVRGIKIHLANDIVFYIDGQLHTIWSAPQVPYDFSSTLYHIKSYIDKYFQQDKPFVLFMLPGFDVPTKEIFDFILSLDPGVNRIVSLSLYGNKFEELEFMRISAETKKRGFVFGLWPWQFGQFRKIKTMGEFRTFYFAPLKKNFYIAEGQIELLQLNVKQGFILKAAFLKTNPKEKTRLIILNNLVPEKMSLEELVGLYLSHWPNLEETFQDFNRKIELFTYTATSNSIFSIESLKLSKEPPFKMSILFEQYLKALDLYVRWHFLPSGYENKDFSTMQEEFYNLQAILNRQEGYTEVIFRPPQEFSRLKDLQYACRRLNEKELIFSDGKRLWFSV